MEHDWLISSDVNGKITRYEYNTDNSIKRIKHPSGSIETFEYYPQGWLKGWRLMKNNTEMVKKKYNFMGEATITTITYPNNVTLTLTYDENGEIALRKRLGYSTEKIQNTDYSKIISQGDSVSMTYWQFTFMEDLHWSCRLSRIILNNLNASLLFSKKKKIAYETNFLFPDFFKYV